MKSISQKAHDINKQTVYIAPKSKIESTAHQASFWISLSQEVYATSHSRTKGALHPGARTGRYGR